MHSWSSESLGRCDWKTGPAWPQAGVRGSRLWIELLQGHFLPGLCQESPELDLDWRVGECQKAEETK